MRVMTEAFAADSQTGAASLAQRIDDFARSAVFERMYRDGMAMVEETAGYLDGPGRAAAKRLPRPAALAYAGESMRLTTRLMQIASWLMVQRAVRDGEMPAAEARQEKFRLASRPDVAPFHGAEDLPAELLDLIARAERLHERVRRFDATIFDETAATAQNPVVDQLARLKSALEGGAA